VPNIIETWIFNDQSHKVAEAKKTILYVKCWHFWHFEIKEAIEVIKAVEVIMADGAKEATEVVRFT
jgi:hypothetical protein